MDEMTKKYVREKIRIQIADGLEKEGFKYVKSNERIMRQHKSGFDVIYITVIDYYPIFQIEFGISIRLDAVEEIVNQFLDENFINPKGKRYTTTIGASYRMLSNTQHNYIEIKNEDELNEAICQLITLIGTKGLSFLEKYHDINLVNEVNKKQLLIPNNYVCYIPHNIMQSLALLKLCDDPDFDALKLKYKELYMTWEGHNDKGKKAIDDLVTYLENM